MNKTTKAPKSYFNEKTAAAMRAESLQMAKTSNEQAAEMSKGKVIPFDIFERRTARALAASQRQKRKR
jgi:hypothetical protein